MANGGVVTNPTIAALAERGGAEAVIPLKNGAVPVTMDRDAGGTTVNVNVSGVEASRLLQSDRQTAMRVGEAIGRQVQRSTGRV